MPWKWYNLTVYEKNLSTEETLGIDKNLLLGVEFFQGEYSFSDKSCSKVHSDEKISIQNIKTFSSDSNAPTVWLVVYKYSD